jgi:hypothetical protein
MARTRLWYELRIFYDLQFSALKVDLHFFSADFQAKYDDFLKEIDALKASAKIPAVDLLRSMTVSFSQQSCAIEGNTLGLYDTQKVWNSLRRNFDLNNFLKDSETPLPTPSSLSDEPENEVIEIRNHLLATHFLYSTLYDLTHEIDLCHIKRLHRILLKDTPMEKVELEDDKFHDNEDELIQHAGDFRKIEVESRGSIYTVYPVSYYYSFVILLPTFDYDFAFSIAPNGSSCINGKIYTIP